MKIYQLICLLALTKRRGVQSRIVHAPMFSALVCRTFRPNSFLREIVLQLSPGLLIAFLVAWAGTRERKTDLGLSQNGHLCVSLVLISRLLWRLYCAGCADYRLSSIKGVQFRFANFASHFIRSQIFQIDFSLI